MIIPIVTAALTHGDGTKERPPDPSILHPTFTAWHVLNWDINSIDMQIRAANYFAYYSTNVILLGGSYGRWILSTEFLTTEITGWQNESWLTISATKIERFNLGMGLSTKKPFTRDSAIKEIKILAMRDIFILISEYSPYLRLIDAELLDVVFGLQVFCKKS